MIARLPLVQQWLDTTRPDVLCLQETKCIDERFPSQTCAEIGYLSEDYGQPSYNGVAILSSTRCADVQRGLPDDEAGAHARLLAATIEAVRVVNVYIPNGQSVGTD